MADIDLAYSCVDTAGAASSSTFVLNRLIRTRQDTPSQLRDLSAQAAAAKQVLEQLLSMIDSDEPSFTSESDATEISGHLDDMAAVFREVQEHAAKVARASRSIEKSTWTIVWPVTKMAASEEALKDKLAVIASYMDGSKRTEVSAPSTEALSRDSNTQAVSAEPPRQDPAASSEPSSVQSTQTVQEDSAEAGPSSSNLEKSQTTTTPRQSGPSILNEKAQMRIRELGATAVSLGSSQSAAIPQSPLSGGDHEVPLSAVDSPPQYEETERQFQQMHSQQSQQQEQQEQQQTSQQSITARRGTAGSSQSPPAPPGSGGQSLSPQQQVQLQRQIQPFQKSLAATAATKQTVSPASTVPAVEAAKSFVGLSRMSMISARQMKSSLLLTKSNSFGTDHEENDAGLPQGDELFPDRFLERVTNYSRGITPAWAPVTIPAKKKNKADKQKYRNRFTSTKDLDVSPEHLTSHFKVVEKDIWDAILHRRPERVQQIMEHKWRDNIVVEKQDAVTALHVAAALGLCRIVRILLSFGATPNATDRYGLTPLHYAADFGCARCVRLLIDAGAQVDKDLPKQDIKMPLRYAVAMANTDAVSALLEKGAILHVQTSAPEDTLLYAAVSTGDVGLCELLLKAGLNPKESFEVLAMAATKSVELLSTLVGAGADINLQGPPAPPPSEKPKKGAPKAYQGPGDTLLHKYVTLDDMRMVDFLLGSLQASPNVVGDEGRYPLHITATPSTSVSATSTTTTTTGTEAGAHSVLITQALLAHGADTEVRNALGQTPLQAAVLWGRADMAKLLCSSGASLDAADDAGLTPWSETQRADYVKRPGTTNLLGRYHVPLQAEAAWRGRDFRGVAEIVSARRAQMRQEQQMHQGGQRQKQKQKQHQYQPLNKVEMMTSHRPPVELPLISAESRPVQEVHGESLVISQRALEERRADEFRAELPA